MSVRKIFKSVDFFVTLLMLLHSDNPVIAGAFEVESPEEAQRSALAWNDVDKREIASPSLCSGSQ